MSRPRILVLGACGSIGRPIADAVAGDPSLVLVAGLRRPPAGGRHEYRLLDATRVDEMTAALRGMTHVINAAGGPPATLRATGRALAAALAHHPATRLVHLSSMAVYGARTGLVDEDAPLSPRNEYAAAKIDAEVALAPAAARGQVVILRPGIVTGPNSAQWTGRLSRLLQAGRLGDLGPAGDGFCNKIDEAVLARLCIRACLTEGAAGRIFNVGNAAPPTWNDYLIALARQIGATPVRRPTPWRLAMEARVLAPALAAARRVAGFRRTPDAIPPSLLRLFAQRIRLDCTRADAVLCPLPAARLAAE